VLGALSAHNHALLVGRSFFPHLISPPFQTGLHEAFAFAIGACLVVALASFFRGGLARDAGDAGADPDRVRGSGSARGVVESSPPDVFAGQPASR